MSVFVGSSTFATACPSTCSAYRPHSTTPTAVVHAGTVGVCRGHVTLRSCNWSVVMVVMMGWGCWGHRFGPAPKHGCCRRVVHVHVVVTTPRCGSHAAEPGSGGREDRSSRRQTGRQFGRLREIGDVDVHVDVGFVEAGDGRAITVHLCGVVQHRSQTGNLPQIHSFKLRQCFNT